MKAEIAGLHDRPMVMACAIVLCVFVFLPKSVFGQDEDPLGLAGLSSMPLAERIAFGKKSGGYVEGADLVFKYSYEAPGELFVVALHRGRQSPAKTTLRIVTIGVGEYRVALLKKSDKGGVWEDIGFDKLGDLVPLGARVKTGKDEGVLEYVLPLGFDLVSKNDMEISGQYRVVAGADDMVHQFRIEKNGETSGAK